MRTRIKRRMLALWLSVCMVLTMIPSMAVPTFAAPASLTAQVEQHTGKLTAIKGTAEKMYYTFLSADPTTKKNSWEDDRTTYEAAKGEIEELESGATWNEFSDEGTTLSYADKKEYLLVVGVASDKIKGADVLSSFDIDNPDPSLTSMTVKGKEISSLSGKKFTSEESNQVNLGSSAKVIEETWSYAEATGEEQLFSSVKAGDSDGATVAAYLMTGAPQNQVNIGTWVSEDTTKTTLNTNTTALWSDKKEVNKWIVVEVTSANGGAKAYYVVKAHIQAADTDTTLTSVKIKGKEIVTNLKAPISSADAENGVKIAPYISEVTLTYKEASEATSNPKFSFEAKNAGKTTAEAHLLTGEPSLQGNAMIKTLFDDAGGNKLDENTGALDDTKKPGVKWVIIKVDSEDSAKTEYYVVKVTIEAADPDASLQSASIKGTNIPDLVELTSEEAAKVDLTKTDAENKKYSEITLTYEKAIDEVTETFSYVLKSSKANVETRIVKAAKMNNEENANVVAAFAEMDQGYGLSGKNKIKNVEEYPQGISKWVVIKTTADDESVNNYYVVKINVKPAVGTAYLNSASVKGVSVDLGDPIAKDGNSDYKASLEVGSHARGSVLVPYAKAIEATSIEQLLATGSEGAAIEAVKVASIATLSDVNIKSEYDGASDKVLEADGTEHKGALTRSTTGDNFWILVKVTAKNKTDINYYAINVAVEAASNEAKLLTAAIKEKTATPPAAIVSETKAKTVDLTDKNNYTEVLLTYEQATSTTLKTFVGTPSPNAKMDIKMYESVKVTSPKTTDLTNLSGGTTVTSDTTKDAISGIADGNAGTAWIVVKVTPESGDTTAISYYVFKLTVSEQYIIKDTLVLGKNQPVYASGIAEDAKIELEKIKYNTTNLDVSGTGYTAAMDELALELSGKKEYSVDALKAKYDTLTYLHIEPYLDVQVDEYNMVGQVVTYDVTPKYNVIVTDNETKGSHEAFEVLETGNILDVPEGENVTVKLPLPSSMGSVSPLYVKHEAKSATYIYNTSSGGSDPKYVSFTNNHGFSKFTIMKDDPAVAEFGSEKYFSFKDAVAAAEKAAPDAITEQTIELKKKPAEGDYPATVTKAITLTLDGPDSVWPVTEKDLEDLLAVDGSVELKSTDKADFGSNKKIKFVFENKINEPVEPDDPLGPDEPTDPNTGELTVSKRVVSNDAADKDKAFTFTITVTADPAVNGSYNGIQFANGVATITLKDGESKTAIGLPAGATYKVEETAVEGFTSSATGATGTIGAVASTAAFTNTKSSGEDQPTPPPVGENTLRFASSTQEEALKDRATNDKDCALKLEAVDGADIGDLSSWKVESDNPDVVQVLDNNELRYMDLGTANITVTATGKDGKIYTITFPVNVTKLGTPTFTLSHVSSKKARTFTVTTSTVRGATGFQVQYSLRKSLKSSKQPSYAVGKKLNRKTIKANKSKRTYYVRVRAYKIVDGERINGAWSKLTKKIKSR